jgi:hypothetical protein
MYGAKYGRSATSFPGIPGGAQLRNPQLQEDNHQYQGPDNEDGNRGNYREREHGIQTSKQSKQDKPPPVAVSAPGRRRE